MSSLEKLISKKDLIAIGYSDYSASQIIRKSKQLLVEQGFPYYRNRRVGKVPASTVEKVIGLSLNERSKE
ncbi:DUF3173 family protein [Enterococcus faecalis]|uniref:DUF3173 family protein n=1 Tax=Enterococcus faecalis TaxID=1351 RepID=UPI001E551EC1|nr:DUF3173 family protein [Enterococcus faecalis]EHR4852417.1 DUF3173 family protein [Enterococcus faecalis]EMC0698290.1 DUF3173 family protein [Enterococcus faecalis]MCD5130303.1 DUF3173 family protein [Enterococcus faecalis]MDV2557217.1 DUF3173 family protein [Enterococcus faecalis]MDY2531924.1 DUF3173 family protein [Enterococcus faecalis]